MKSSRKNNHVLTDAKVLVPHGVQPYEPSAHLGLEGGVVEVRPEDDVVVDGEVLAEVAQVGDPGLVLGVAATADQD